MKEDDKDWDPPSKIGKQELEIVMGDEHIAFVVIRGLIIDIKVWFIYRGTEK